MSQLKSSAARCAEPIVAGGGGLLVDDGELTADWIRANVVPILGDAERVAQMSEAAALMGRRDADVALARMVARIVAESRNRPEATA